MRESNSQSFETSELQKLQSVFEASTDRFAHIRDIVERDVVRWVWATAPCYNLDPLHFFDSQVRAGTVLEAEPTDKRGAAAYGLTAAGRIITERIYTAGLNGEFYQTFFAYGAGRIISRPRLFQRWATRGWTSRAFTVVENRICAFTDTYQQDGEPSIRLTGRLRYEVSGTVEVATRWPGSSREKITFRGKAPSMHQFLGN